MRIGISKKNEGGVKMKKKTKKKKKKKKKKKREQGGGNKRGARGTTNWRAPRTIEGEKESSCKICLLRK